MILQSPSSSTLNAYLRPLIKFWFLFNFILIVRTVKEKFEPYLLE